MYIPLDWPTICLCLGLLGLYLLLSAPVPSAVRAEKRARWQARRDEWTAWKAERTAWRRRVFGSHPHLYWSLAWFGVPVLSCVLAILMGW